MSKSKGYEVNVGQYVQSKVAIDIIDEYKSTAGVDALSTIDDPVVKLAAHLLTRCLRGCVCEKC